MSSYQISKAPPEDKLKLNLIELVLSQNKEPFWIKVTATDPDDQTREIEHDYAIAGFVFDEVEGFWRLQTPTISDDAPRQKTEIILDYQNSERVKGYIEIDE